MWHLIILWIDRIVDGLGKLAALLLILLVLIMAWNVIGRYAFRASSLGLEELSWHLYAAVFLLGIPYAMQTGSHVRVDLLYEKFSPRNRALVDVIGSLLFMLPFCAVVVWAGWQFSAAAYGLGQQPGSVGEFFSMLVSSGIGERSQDPGGLLNRWIIKGVIPFAFFMLMLAGISFFTRRLRVFLGLEEEQATVERLS